MDDEERAILKAANDAIIEIQKELVLPHIEEMTYEGYELIADNTVALVYFKYTVKKREKRLKIKLEKRARQDSVAWDYSHLAQEFDI